MEKFIRGKAKLLVPHDHVQLLRRHIGSALNARLQQGLRLPPGTDPVKWVNSFVDRIDSIGILTTDLETMLEAARKYLPKEQVERLQREANAIRKLRRT